jgi:8-oxo-dGTP diphosphatase
MEGKMPVKKLNWSEFDRGVFLLNVHAVIFKGGEILIGKRENDPYIKQLTWCFPGGRPAYNDDLEDYLHLEVKKKTGLDIESERVIFAKTYPEDRRFLSIYYLSRIIGGEEKAGEKFVEIKWVKPEELKDYFTTSLHPKLYQIIVDLTR